MLAIFEMVKISIVLDSFIDFTYKRIIRFIFYNYFLIKIEMKFLAVFVGIIATAFAETNYFSDGSVVQEEIQDYWHVFKCPNAKFSIGIVKKASPSKAKCQFFMKKGTRKSPVFLCKKLCRHLNTSVEKEIAHKCPQLLKIMKKELC